MGAQARESETLKVPFDPASIRPDYAVGTWAYALGRPACEHRDYAKAVELAESAGWNPWFIRQWGDVPAVLNGAYFDPDAAQRVVEFFRLLRHTTGAHAGHRFDLLDWQQWDLVYPLFGWKASDGTRRYGEAYIEVPKKNGKTTMCSGLSLYMLFGDGEESAEVYAGATTRDQASIVYKEAAKMVRASASLMSRLRLIDHRKMIHHDVSNSLFRVLSADVEAHEGLNIHGAVVDELHVHKDRILYDTLKHGGAARTQPLMIIITTAGQYDPLSIGWEQHEAARQVLDGMVENQRLFAYIASTPEDQEQEWRSPDVWKRANPSWGETINIKTALEMIDEAESKPGEISKIKRYRLNVWERQVSAWMLPEVWDACAAEYTEADLEGMDCFGGLDLSQSDDLTALALMFPPQGELEKFRLLTYFWLPSDTIREHDRYYNGMYGRWADGGLIQTTEGNTIDYRSIRLKVQELGKRFNIREIYFDKFFASMLVQQLQDDDRFEMREHGQSAADMNNSVTEMMNLCKKQELEHNNHPVMNWHIGNAKPVSDYQGRTKIMKLEMGKRKKQKRIKVDGVIASLMALTGASRFEPAGDYYIGY